MKGPFDAREEQGQQDPTSGLEIYEWERTGGHLWKTFKSNYAMWAGIELEKKSILLELPYWRTHLLRHNINVMYVETNVYGMLLETRGDNSCHDPST